MATKPDSSSCCVPLRFWPTACAAGTKAERGKSLLSKSPSGSGDLEDIAQKERKKEATKEIPKPLCCHNTLPTTAPSSHLISLLPVSPILTPFSLSQPAIPLITTLWLPLPLLSHKPRWANIAHFTQGGKLDTWAPTAGGAEATGERERRLQTPRYQLPFLFQ